MPQPLRSVVGSVPWKPNGAQWGPYLRTTHQLPSCLDACTQDLLLVNQQNEDQDCGCHWHPIAQAYHVSHTVYEKTAACSGCSLLRQFNLLAEETTAGKCAAQYADNQGLYLESCCPAQQTCQLVLGPLQS